MRNLIRARRMDYVRSHDDQQFVLALAERLTLKKFPENGDISNARYL